MRPLNGLKLGENSTKKKILVDWDKECQEAFSKLKYLCSDTPVLAYVYYSRPFKLHTNAFEVGLGAVLYQVQDDGMEGVIAYASHTLLKLESGYDVHKLEFPTLQWTICDQFHKYLYGGRSVSIQTTAHDLYSDHH